MPIFSHPMLRRSKESFASLSSLSLSSHTPTALTNPMVHLLVENSHAQVVGLPPTILDLIRHDLSYVPRAAYTPKPGDLPGLMYLCSQLGSFPAGLTTMVERLLKKYRVEYTVEDRRERPFEDLPLHSGIKLRSYQTPLVDAALNLGRGVVVASPRSGKTTMLGAVIDQNPLPTLWTAPTRAIVRQTVASLRRLLKLGPGNDGVMEVLGGWPSSMKGQREANGARVVVTTVASAVKFPESFWRTRKQLIYDEFHHAGADNGDIINNLAAPIFHRYGMTGTHFRSYEETEIRMHALIADVVGRVGVTELIQGGWLVPADIVFLPIVAPEIPEVSGDEAYARGIKYHEARNACSAWAATTLAAGGRRVIVLVKHVDHGEILAGLIPGSVFVKGEDGDGVDENIGRFNRGEIRILIGTSVLGEGIDLPAADALVYAKGGSASVTFTQDYFRVLTGAEGKYPAVIVDFADRHNAFLMHQSAIRGKLYSKEQCFRVHVANTEDPMRDVAHLFAPISMLR
jgi:superfamily II DNA or RNA helicase